MKENLPKISRATNLEDINWCLKENYEEISIDWFPILAKWLDNSYSVFKDHEKYLILILLVKKTFDYYTSNFVQLNWDQFFALKKIELGKFSIIDISKELKISKETTRRKIGELQKINILKKTKNGIIVQPEFYSNTFIKNHETFRKSICAFVSKFSIILYKEKIIKEKIKPELIEKATHQNFSYAWKVFFEMMIPKLIDLKFLFKDLETFHVWGVCALNQNFEIQKYLKLNNGKHRNKDDFFNIHSKIPNPIGINAMSISNISGIPRGTVFRKLQMLIKRKFLFVDKKKLYYPNKKINQTDTFHKLNTLNAKRLSVFINKLLNLTNVSI
tara:strand:- start:146 stop:1135 length:990 start_codon:yes stop_codon:yes gene_type:complete